MKTPRNHRGILLGALAFGALMLSPAMLSAQDEQAGRQPMDPPRQQEGPQAPQALRMNRIMRRIAELRQAGKYDEANQLEQRVRAATAGNPRMAQQFQGGRGQWQPRLGGNDGNPQMLQPFRNPRGEWNPDIAGEPGKGAMPGQSVSPLRMKMMHLRQAAGHLQAAGYPEYANKAREEIGRIEGEVKRQEVEAKRQAAEARRQAAEANRGNNPDANAGMMAEMNKLRREMEELRGQIRKLKAEAAPREPAMRRPQADQPPVRRPQLDQPPVRRPQADQPPGERPQ